MPRGAVDADAEVAGEANATLSIGALSRATGIPVATLRTWEKRYAFPSPLRRPSGHRLYPIATVPRLRRMAAALARGLRAGDVLVASEAELEALIDGIAVAPPAATVVTPEDLLPLVRRLDGEALTAALLADAARLAPLDFVEARVAPLLRAVGEAWAADTLEVRHEHLLAERVGDVLRSQRLALAGRAAGRPLVVLATLPGERHVLGLQMAALVVAAAGCGVLYLGAETPVVDLAAAARDARASACAVSVSAVTRGAATSRALARLRRALPAGVRLIAGGGGAPPRAAGIEVVAGLRELDAWARALR